jgi:hypothetical protein
MYVNKFRTQGRGQEGQAGIGNLLMLIRNILIMPCSYANAVWFLRTHTALVADLGSQWSPVLEDGTDGKAGATLPFTRDVP